MTNPTREQRRRFADNLRAEMTRQSVGVHALAAKMPEGSPVDVGEIFDATIARWYPDEQALADIGTALGIDPEWLTLGPGILLGRESKARKIAQWSEQTVAGESTRKTQELTLLRDTIGRLMVPDWAEHEWTHEKAEAVIAEAVAKVGLGEYKPFTERWAKEGAVS